MNLNDFVAKFADQFDETEPSEITPNCDFKNLEEWSSLTALSIIAFIKMEFGKTITAADIRSCTTVEDLFNFVEKHD